MRSLVYLFAALVLFPSSDASSASGGRRRRSGTDDDINDDEDSSGPIDLSESDDLLNEVEQFLRERDNEN